MPSARHLILQRRSSALQRNLLPRTRSLTGDYSGRQLDQIAAYLVLVHAEIESYFEDMVYMLIDHSLGKWATSNKLSKALFSMLVYYEGDRKGPPQSFDSNQFRDRNIETLVHQAAAQHKARVRNNNGIREKDLCAMLFPIGFSYNDLNMTLVASLDSFGQRRGDLAHQSLHKTPNIDPFSEAATVQTIVTEIGGVDPLFNTFGK